MRTSEALFEEVKLALRSLYALYPMACYLIGAFLMMRFSLNEAEHRVIRQELDRRRAARPSAWEHPCRSLP